MLATKCSLYLCIISVSLLAVAPRAISASFDCAKASGATESLICKNADLSALDDELQSAYKATLAAVAPSSKKALIEEQRHWITYTRDVCQDAACLKQVYTARIEVLTRNEKYIIDKTSCEVPSGGGACVYVVIYRDPSIQIGSFNKSLAEQKQSSKIISCSRLINLPVGTAHGNNSYGGMCTLQNGTQRKAVEICNDDMFGHFQMQTANPQGASDKKLIDFIYDNCVGS